MIVIFLVPLLFNFMFFINHFTKNFNFEFLFILYRSFIFYYVILFSFQFYSPLWKIKFKHHPNVPISIFDTVLTCSSFPSCLILDLLNTLLDVHWDLWKQGHRVKFVQSQPHTPPSTPRYTHDPLIISHQQRMNIYQGKILPKKTKTLYIIFT
jgi:hypothetical protein